MTTLEQQARQIAAKLTKAQRAAMIELPPHTFAFWPCSIGRVTIKRLIELGLLTRRAPAHGFGLAVHEWTPLGLAVKAILEEKNDGE